MRGDVVEPELEHALIEHYGLDYDGDGGALPSPGDAPRLRKLI